MNEKSSQMASNDDIAAALAQFNTGVATSRELDKEAKAIAKAEKRRDLAAQKLKELMENDANGPDRATLEEEYRTAVDDLTRLSNPNSDDRESSVEQGVDSVAAETTPTQESSEDPVQEGENEDQQTA
ncbi:MAG TPA: hypothetical protein DHV80_04180 [Acidimicrobiaceae bacterium]|nr:MAG: hypothetical protein CBD84_04655 [Acidimicrobiaceae bacterium TMED224]HCJ85733.1 hypothetical protein [Acidimicrobiaceae bacterium]|tara:strand:+ start:2051 stop:2434 length:384 start_codon:yes stop_codon:yes gene_type:complete